MPDTTIPIQCWPALKQLKRRPFPAQALAIMGVAKRWEEPGGSAAVVVIINSYCG
jgi:hypothetical protein